MLRRRVLAALIEAMRTARNGATRLSASISFNSERAERCRALTAPIDQLGGDLTGNAAIFHTKGHSQLAQPPKG